MKNKKNVYILLPIVLLIWGSVVYKFFSFKSPEEEVADTKQKIKYKPLEIDKADTIPLDVNFRDPFLGKAYTSETQVASNEIKSIARKTVRQEELPIQWPLIVYKGMVSDTKDKTKVFMLVINGKTCLMKKGSIEDEIFLKDGDKNSVYVKYKGNLNIILQQE